MLRSSLKTYKLFRIRGGKLYPLYVESKREMPIGIWLEAGIGEKVDATHVKASGCGGRLSLRPGFHSCEVPFTDWIGKRGSDGSLLQRPDTVWCECEIDGNQLEVTERYGLRTIPDGWYYFKTNPKQIWPWIISKRIRINRILSHEEVGSVCASFGITAQKIWAENDGGHEYGIYK